MKLNLVNDGIFPILKDKDGKSLNKSLDTGLKTSGTVQGEGKLSGVPCLFIRLSACNLRCVFLDDKGGATPCDTSYSSHYAETNMVEIPDVIETIKQNIGNIKHVVVSGGEPTLQKEQLASLLEGLKDLGLHTTIETNATIFTEDIAEHTDLISMSPKLRTSNPTKEAIEKTGDDKLKYNVKWEAKHERDRKNIEVIQKYIDSCYHVNIINATEGQNTTDYSQRSDTKDFQLKFVISKPEDLNEIKKDFLSKLKGWKNEDVMLMPEGITVDELMTRSKWVTELCVKEGFRFCPRLHALLFGIKRSV